ncbi:hypothetical protein SAMN02745121_05446 [Nannocystis exedens]|uniref:Tetratricopeptide repeat-containing protein n=1 Tax=Nannocystis exedens TaxID=54 RepID=A0A1I2D872_9BACT|nr:hypothetical protein [Nannocystis exedens]PCC70669.1 hypothetical protein NAEX_03733 [Nannocystis exedens]SFE76689.1 hypothetical protein SAMN02745121_05446 [Nannocystis exedens]
MDIWQWVHDIDPELRRGGHVRLADLIRRIPSATVDDHHDRVDALAPEALALARAAGLPWVEVFVRHWHLQSRVLHRCQGDMALGEAVALVDYAHGEAARGCPQAVCTVQDLAACYSQVDGPGWARERADVSRETLARIDPTWPCFTCISCEHAGALREQGDPQAALEFLDAQHKQLVAAGQGREGTSLLPERISCLIALGRTDDALAACEDAIANGRRDESQRRARQIDLARIYARLGRGDDALRHLPVPADILPTPSHYDPYTDALVHLVRIGAWPNGFELGRLLQRFIARLQLNGSHRLPFDIAAAAADLAIQRGSPEVAALHLAAMERLAARLHRPGSAPERLAALRLSLETALAQPRGERPDDPEERLRDCVAADPAAVAADPSAHARRHAAALLDLGFAREAADLLERHVDAHPDDDDAVELLEVAYRHAEDDDRHRALGERLLASADPAKQRRGRWVSARRHTRARDWDAANRLLAQLAEDPADALAARLAHAGNARQQRDWPTVLRLVDEALQLQPDLAPGAYDWDRMVAATFLGAWDRVRHSAARLDMEIDGEGPIDLRWELCRIRVEHPSGKRQDLYAARTGPVTARILQISRIDQPQRLFDQVVFDARPLGSHEDDDGQPVYLYAEIDPLHRAGYRAFSIDGVHPGEAALGDLRRVVQAHRGSFQVQSGDRYRLTSPAGEERPGLYAFAAFGPDADLRAASDALAAVIARLGDPLVWPELAAAAGDDARAQQHRELARAWML